MEIKIKEDDLVLCTVKKIEGTTVFVTIEDNGEGSIVMSEIAAGRIRNLRDYVSPNKKIVCKVLKTGSHPQLSLRRVTAKERESIMEEHKKEKTFTGMLKKIIKSPERAIEEIKLKHKLSDFIDLLKEDVKQLEKFFSKTESKLLEKILAERAEKKKTVKKTFTLKSLSPSGLLDIKEILDIKEVKINYLGSSKFSIEASADNFKEANQKISEALKQIEEKAKKSHTELKIKEK